MPKSTSFFPLLLVILGLVLPGRAMLGNAETQAGNSTNSRFELPRRTYPAGETNYCYHVIAIEGVNPKADEHFQGTAKFLIKETVGPAEKSEAQQVVYKTLSGKFKVWGSINKEEDVTAQTPAIVFYREPGGRLHSKTEGGSSDIFDHFSFGTRSFGPAEFAYYPSKPVKIGESWAAMAEGENVGKVKLEAVEKVGDVECFRLRSSIFSKPNAVNPHKKRLDTLEWMEKSTGRIVKSRQADDFATNGVRLHLSMEADILDSTEAEAMLHR